MADTIEVHVEHPSVNDVHLAAAEVAFAFASAGVNALQLGRLDVAIQSLRYANALKEALEKAT